MPNHPVDPADLFLTRRNMLTRCGMGMGALALSNLVGRAGELQAASTLQAAPASELAKLQSAGRAMTGTPLNPLAAKQPQFPGKAKHVIHLFMNGGPSQVDTFDPKPSLTKYHGQPLPASFKTERKTGSAMRSPFEFKRYGQSGLEVSDLFAKTASAAADDLCVIRSMNADVPNHEPSLMLMNCGESRLPRPSMGAWVTYGLGTENQNLPGFVVMCPGGYPIQESQNWQSGFLPGVLQGTHIDTQYTDIRKLIEFIKSPSASPADQRRQLDLLMALNRKHQQRRQEDLQLESRIQSFELAFRMQAEASDAFDVSKEPQHILDMYGPGTQARQILIARRLVERGVRFVQVWHGQGQPWDSHDDLETAHRNLANQCDQAIGALLTDLRQRGLLDDTLVIWGGEFGRTPVVEMPTPGANQGKMNGRDHNHYGFSMWMAGGGAKPGVYGATDEFGFRAEQNPVHVHDLHATILHLLGFDHEKFTYRYAGRDFRLTDVHGRVVKELLA